MAQITLNLKSNSESFTINDNDIIYVNPYYVSGSVAGAMLTVIDTASAVTTAITVEEEIADIMALTTALVQITTTQNESPLINISRIKDIYTYGSYANIRYDDNGNVFSVIKTNMTTSAILSAIQTEENVPKKYVATLTQSGTNAPVATVLENTLGGTVVWARVDLGRYTATLTGAFPDASKVFIKTTAGRFDNLVDFNLIEILAQRTSANTIHLANLKSSSSLEDDILTNDGIEILVYP